MGKVAESHGKVVESWEKYKSSKERSGVVGKVEEQHGKERSRGKSIRVTRKGAESWEK